MLKSVAGLVVLAAGVKAQLENCVTVDETYNFHWTVDSAANTITVMTESLNTPSEYVAWGLPFTMPDTGNVMIGGDAQIGYITLAGQPEVIDYYMVGVATCTESAIIPEVCPDLDTTGTGSMENTAITATVESGITSIMYTRPIDTGNSNNDRVIELGVDQLTLFAVGTLDDVSGFINMHTKRFMMNIDFARTPLLECSPFTVISAGGIAKPAAGLAALLVAAFAFLA